MLGRHFVFCFLLSLLSLKMATSVQPSVGQPIPMPQMLKKYVEDPLTLDPKFSLVPIGAECDILPLAVARYSHLINAGKSPSSCANETRVLRKFIINVAFPCVGVYPSEKSNEAYSLLVKADGAVVKASEVWGALRALETFSQMVHLDAASGCLRVSEAHVEDFPRFPHRGLLLDTSRHFIKKRNLLSNLDAMSFAKLNVFHWHIVDDQSFPYASTTFPNLTNGAYDANFVYSQSDVAEIVEYARRRGIRVVPEFDTPGHTGSWRIGLPDLLTPCYSEGKPDGSFQLLNPAKDYTFDVLKKLSNEWRRVFADDFFHIGGDETDFKCWQSNPQVQEFMKLKNFTTNGQLEEYYFDKIISILSDSKFSLITWQDPLLHGVKFPENTVVQIWLGDYNNTLKNVTKTGHRAILSSPWYLNYRANPYSFNYLKDYYKADPTNFNGTMKEKALVMGGEACLWAEYTNNDIVLSNIWPAAFFVAERLWSSETVTDFDDVMSRVDEMQCRLDRRGISYTPITGPGFCRDTLKK